MKLVYSFSRLYGILAMITMAVIMAEKLPAKAEITLGKALYDIAYGPGMEQAFDVYLPENKLKAPVIFMIHGGGWRGGDKASGHVVKNKVQRWVKRGFIFVSVNYRVLPEADPLEQAKDVARGLAKAQKMAPQWGGDPSRFIVMGHSSGAHLAALLAADPEFATSIGAQSWLTTILIDSSALDLVRVMRNPHHPFYDHAFGEDADFWKKVSPWHRFKSPVPPILAICSSLRTNPCLQAGLLKERARSFGTKVTLLPISKRHKALNRDLGLENDYTPKVEDFMASLDIGIARLLNR